MGGLPATAKLHSFLTEFISLKGELRQATGFCGARTGSSRSGCRQMFTWERIFFPDWRSQPNVETGSAILTCWLAWTGSSQGMGTADVLSRGSLSRRESAQEMPTSPRDWSPCLFLSLFCHRYSRYNQLGCRHLHKPCFLGRCFPTSRTVCSARGPPLGAAPAAVWRAEARQLQEGRQAGL